MKLVLIGMILAGLWACNETSIPMTNDVDTGLDLSGKTDFRNAMDVSLNDLSADLGTDGQVDVDLGPTTTYKILPMRSGKSCGQREVV